MGRRSLTWVILILCFGLIMTGCPKKAVKTDEGAVTNREDAAVAAAREKEARESAERERAERAGREAARIKEEDARRTAAEKEAEKQKKEFEKSLVAKQTPGI